MNSEKILVYGYENQPFIYHFATYFTNIQKTTYWRVQFHDESLGTFIEMLLGCLPSWRAAS